LTRRLKKIDEVKEVQQAPPETVYVSASQYLLDITSNFENKFAPAFLKIQTKKADLSNFELNEVQHRMEDIFADIRRKGRLVRVVVLKSRRKGISTWVSGRFFYNTTTNKNRHAMIITHEPEATDFVFKMHKRFYENLPDFFKPEERYNNRKMLEFNNEVGTGLDSAIRVGTAGKEELGAGTLIHYLHISELSKWPRHLTTNLLLNLMQCVPPIPNSEVVIESTAKGVGGEFHDRYWNSRYMYTAYLDENGKCAYREVINKSASESNEFTSIFLPWFIIEDNEMEPRPGFQRTEEEEKMVKEFNLDAGGRGNYKLQWRRYAIENQCNGDIDKFHQEYPSTDIEAFLSANDNIFNVEQLKELIKIAPEAKARYKVQESTGIFIADSKGSFEVYEEPIIGRTYVVSGDPSEGLPAGNPSCIDVIDAITGKQVAHYHGRIPPELMGTLSAQIGSRYNSACIAMERNNHGIAVIDKIIDMGYKNIYVEEVVEKHPVKSRKRFGWVTSRSSKVRIIDHLVNVMRENPKAISCKETMEEMIYFKQFEDGTIGGEIGRNDDRVMSIAIGMYVAANLPAMKRFRRAAIQGAINTLPQKTEAQPAVSPRAWT
jgi:hypothetical protein